MFQTTFGFGRSSENIYLKINTVSDIKNPFSDDLCPFRAAF
ncbi:hypothetical protein MCC93_02260 [Morococcus cerebrosus]|uniref:Uncharacterized protein n=1 Tax=Morococcus cerebrosus TaxID=1056807 RepID=A0A0C1H5I4_9NEIS|nr:hypothetical protein MCC93_02260 [Morococcus cerebrosus]